MHGLSAEFLQDKPRFREVAHEFLEFVRGAELIIHNAPFDVGFLDHELRLMDLQPIAEHCPQITDTLRMARDLHPGKRNGLDALCERYQVDNSARTLHGALLDAELLAEVYLAMTRGQETLLMDLGPATRGAGEAGGRSVHLRAGGAVRNARRARRAPAAARCHRQGQQGCLPVEAPRGRCRSRCRLAEIEGPESC